MNPFTNGWFSVAETVNGMPIPKQEEIPNHVEAFSNKVKRFIKTRAQNRSELSFSNEEPLEVAHLNHSRDEDYLDPGNGLLVTSTEHLAHHLIHRGNAQAIGLTEEGNEWAIGQLFDRVFGFYRQRGVPDLYIQQRIDNAVHRWDRV